MKSSAQIIDIPQETVEILGSGLSITLFSLYYAKDNHIYIKSPEKSNIQPHEQKKIITMIE